MQYSDTGTVDRTMLGVERALAELRRGRPVRIEGEGKAVLALPVEGATPDSLKALTRQAGHPPRLVLTRERAAFLGLKGEGAAVALSLPAAEPLEWARQLAWAVPLNDRKLPEVAAVASLLELRGVELLKHGQLLPALLAAPLDPETAREEAWTDQILGVEADAVAAYPARLLRSLKKIGEARVPLSEAEDSRFVLFRGADGMTEHVAILVGRPDTDSPVLVRLHSACLTGDLFGSLRCDCGEQLRSTIAAMAQAGGGVLLYLAQEGRNIGLANKLRAYAIQDAGYDTLDANALLGFGHDERRYDIAAEMLRQLGFERIRLMTNNPLKLEALRAEGLDIADRVPVIVPVNPHNEGYLATKAERAGHMLKEQ